MKSSTWLWIKLSFGCFPTPNRRTQQVPTSHFSLSFNKCLSSTAPRPTKLRGSKIPKFTKHWSFRNIKGTECYEATTYTLTYTFHHLSSSFIHYAMTLPAKPWTILSTQAAFVCLDSPTAAVPKCIRHQAGTEGGRDGTFQWDFPTSSAWLPS